MLTGMFDLVRAIEVMSSHASTSKELVGLCAHLDLLACLRSRAEKSKDGKKCKVNSSRQQLTSISNTSQLESNHSHFP